MMRRACQEVQKQWVEIRSSWNPLWKILLTFKWKSWKKFILQQYEKLLKYILKVKKKQDNNQEYIFWSGNKAQRA